MHLETDLWVRDFRCFKFMLETLIESQIYNQITIDGIKFIPRINLARRSNSLGHANLCLNLLMIFKCCFFSSKVKRTMDVHIKLYTITAGRPCPNVLIPLYNICDFHVISKNWNSKKAEILLFYKRRRQIMF